VTPQLETVALHPMELADAELAQSPFPEWGSVSGESGFVAFAA
jgi:hypothetical protein